MEQLSYTEILGTKINITNMQEVVECLNSNLENLRGKYICISNVHTTVMAFRDEEYKNIQNGSILNLPDGKPLSMEQRYLGFSDAGRVPGPDLMSEIFRLSEKKGYSQYFYGSTPETIRKLEKNLKEEYPKLQIAGMHSPPFRPLTEEEDTQIIEKINASRPDFIWVGLGAPKQEKWMAAHKGKLNAVMLGVGAGFDFHAGTVKRAPKWMQEICMEWVWRMMQDPKRLLFRYLDTNFAFLYRVNQENMARKKEVRQIQKQKGLLKVAMIGHKRIPSREGGVEIVVDELSTRMVKQGYTVDAYNRYGKHTAGKKFDQRRGKYYNGIRLITIPTPKNSALNAMVYSFLATIRALFGRYDVIHFHAEGPCTMLWIPKLFGIRVIATIHGLDWQRSKWGNFASRVLKFGEKIAAKYADEVIVLSQNVQKYFREIYGRETLFIPNGVNRPEIKSADLIQQEYGLIKDSYILFLARIVPEKGLHYLIEAFRQLDTDKKLVIAGGSSHSHEYMNQIRKMVAEDSRIIMTDFVHGQTLEELYSNAYAFVLPSDIEGMSLSLLEAMSYGNCCVVSDIKENTEVVGEYAMHFEKGNVFDLRDKLKYLLENPEITAFYQKKSSDYICEKYNWDQVVEQTLKLYAGK